MAASAKRRRRRLGVMFLACAAALLICGMTVVGPHLRGLAFVAYWTLCLLSAVLALLAALLDLRAIGRQARQEQQALLQTAFREIESEADGKSGGPHSQVDR
jgi:hypothetical protein